MTKLVEEQFFVNGEPFYVNGEPFKVTIEQAIEAVAKIESIPLTAKDAVKDFISEQWSQMLESFSDVIIPPELLEKLPDFHSYLELVMQYLNL